MAKLTQEDRDDCTAIVEALRTADNDGGRLSNDDVADQLGLAVERVAKLVGKMRSAGTILPDRRGATPDRAGKEFLASL